MENYRISGRYQTVEDYSEQKRSGFIYQGMKTF